MAVNDGAVMKGWAKEQGTEGTIVRMLADPRGEVTEALGMSLDGSQGLATPPKLGNARCRRFAMVVDKGAVTHVHLCGTPDDPCGDDAPEASFAESILKTLG